MELSYVLALLLLLLLLILLSYILQDAADLLRLWRWLISGRKTGIRNQILVQQFLVALLLLLLSLLRWFQLILAVVILLLLLMGFRNRFLVTTSAVAVDPIHDRLAVGQQFGRWWRWLMCGRLESAGGWGITGNRSSSFCCQAQLRCRGK